MQNIESQRLVGVLLDLKKKGKLGSWSHYAVKYGYSRALFTEITKGRSNASNELISALCKDLGISKSYIFEGVHPRFTESLDNSKKEKQAPPGSDNPYGVDTSKFTGKALEDLQHSLNEILPEIERNWPMFEKLLEQKDKVIQDKDKIIEMLTKEVDRLSKTA